MRTTIHDSVGARGRVRLYLVEGDVTDREAALLLEGNRRLRRRVIDYSEQTNLVTNAGRAAVANKVMTGSSIAIPTHLAVGTTPITPSATDLALSGETFRKVLSTVAVFAIYYMRFAVNFSSSDFAATVRGMGLLNASISGDLWAIVSADVTKSASQSLVAEWRIQVLSS